MNNLGHTNRNLAALANRQYGLVSRQQLLDLGLGRGAIDSRLRTGSLHAIHRGVYAVGHTSLNQRGLWLAAVLAGGEGALLSHDSAAALWGLIDSPPGPVHVTSTHGRGKRAAIQLHAGAVDLSERRTRYGIPVTSVARTLLMAERPSRRRLRRAYEEADRLNLLHRDELERTCQLGVGRRGIPILRQLVAEERDGATRSPLEDVFGALCKRHRLPLPIVNTRLLGLEVDALWVQERLVVELDGYAYHRHRAAFERDRARDAALQAAGYRVVRFTHRRLEQEPAAVAAQLRALLAVGAGSAPTGLR
jgi:hypothetical protein